MTTKIFSIAVTCKFLESQKIDFSSEEILLEIKKRSVTQDSEC